MDDNRFDTLVKSLAGRGDRRAVLKGLFGFGAAAAGGMVLGDRADAARRGYGGPFQHKPEVTPGPCEPFCGVGLCGMPNGCGGVCSCSAPDRCIDSSCAPPCDGGDCDFCIADGGSTGCFEETSLTCSDNTDCQAQFGAGICWQEDSGTYYCFIPGYGI